MSEWPEGWYRDEGNQTTTRALLAARRRSRAGAQALRAAPPAAQYRAGQHGPDQSDTPLAAGAGSGARRYLLEPHGR